MIEWVRFGGVLIMSANFSVNEKSNMVLEHAFVYSPHAQNLAGVAPSDNGSIKTIFPKQLF